MKRFLSTLVVFGLLSVTTNASAACRRLGTQLECELGGRQVLIGTQAAAEPSYAQVFRPHQLNGNDGLFDDHPVPDGPLRLELQNVGVDPGLCWKLGNETYCH
jgi:hypothetical protein